MSPAVSIVVPALGPSVHLERALAALEAALAGRPAGDELLVVDDSGTGVLTQWCAERLERARVLVRASNGGFARALQDGIEAATCELVFCMNSDLLPRMGFLDPLIAALADETVFAAGPRVLRAGAGEQHVESLTRLELERGRLRVRQPFVDDSSAGPAQALCCELRPLPFVLGGACLLRRADYLALGGFDPVFEPFYLEDVDLGWRAWRSGRRCVHVPEAVVEHINQATIAAVAPRDLVHAAIAKNHWLFEWKHLSGVELARHLEALEAQLCDMALNEDRESLEILALALEQCEAVLEVRREDPRAPSFRDLARSSDPLGDRAR